MRVIGAAGEMLGVLPTHEALRLAREADLDLVEVNPKGVPPVCKIMDFGKFKYEEKKKENEAKKRQVQVELKEVKLRPKTDDHDLEVKVKHIRRFLEDGNKVKVTCRFRGREITHPETAEVQLLHFIEHTKDIALVEQTPRMEAKTMTILLAPRAEIRARVAQQVAKRAEMEKQKSLAAKAASQRDDDETSDDEE
ncbi:MAG: translation initiation factor IF-3 [Sandaracinaceae bacterium]